MRGAVTISFRLITTLSSPLARLSFSYSCRFANLSFLVRSGPIYTSRVLSCRASALLRFKHNRPWSNYISGPWFRIQSLLVDFLLDRFICLVVSAAVFV